MFLGAGLPHHHTNSVCLPLDGLGHFDEHGAHLLQIDLLDAGKRSKRLRLAEGNAADQIFLQHDEGDGGVSIVLDFRQNREDLVRTPIKPLAVWTSCARI